MSKLSLRQARIPQGAEALPNPVGTAPGVWMRVGHAVLVVLPGVPDEMRAIMARSVLPRLRRLQQADTVCSRTLRTIGLVELEIQRRLAALRLPPALAVGLYPQLNTVDVRLTLCGSNASNARRELDRVVSVVRKRLGTSVYGEDEQQLEEVVGQLLTRKRRTVAIAESCTGGLIVDRLTNVSGSSRYVLLGVVAYHNRIKQDVLGVPAAMLSRFGAVSAQVARRMAVGARALGRSDIGLAVTGIAGPSGGTNAKPVGLVYLALADRRRSTVRVMRFAGDRLAIKMQTASAALDWLRRYSA